jgi:hypothetical protein
MKSVPNLISYLHEFFQNFSQSLAICFELFNLEIADERAPTVRRRAPRRRHGLKPLLGQRVARPDSRPHTRRPPLDRASRGPPSPRPPRRAAPSPSHATAMLSRRAPRVVRAGRAGSRQLRARGPCPAWPRAAPHCASGLSVVSAQRHSN